jgi:hypothetical protein
MQRRRPRRLPPLATGSRVDRAPLPTVHALPARQVPANRLTCEEFEALMAVAAGRDPLPASVS